MRFSRFLACDFDFEAWTLELLWMLDVGIWSLLNRRRLHPGPEHLSHTPPLGDAASRRERRFRIEDFADRPYARLIQVLSESRKKFAGFLRIVRMNFQPRINEWPDQPRPNRSLMISRIAGAE